MYEHVRMSRRVLARVHALHTGRTHVGCWRLDMRMRLTQAMDGVSVRKVALRMPLPGPGNARRFSRVGENPLCLSHQVSQIGSHRDVVHPRDDGLCPLCVEARNLALDKEQRARRMHHERDAGTPANPTKVDEAAEVRHLLVKGR